MSGPTEKDSRFKPADPVIPGVPQRPPEQQKKEEAPDQPAPSAGPKAAWQSPTVMIGAGIGALVLLAGASLAWHQMKPEPLPAPVDLSAQTATSGSGSASSATAEIAIPDAPGPVATIQELDQPWSVVKFRMRRKTGESAMAMVVRLPSSPGYWGLLSVAPYGRCDLALETNLSKIRQDYGYAATHPMVVDSCTQAVYDPLSLGNASGIWVRGRVAAGPGIRPPYEVEIKVEKGYVIASRSE